ncbi:MAG: hypothetical protein C0418_00415 [Coriobacteriaceae bacterium]|nr:hypothetical protein [Coriobacteriaceae bacterium]
MYPRPRVGVSGLGEAMERISRAPADRRVLPGSRGRDGAARRHQRAPGGRVGRGSALRPAGPRNPAPRLLLRRADRRGRHAGGGPELGEGPAAPAQRARAPARTRARGARRPEPRLPAGDRRAPGRRRRGGGTGGPGVPGHGPGEEVVQRLPLPGAAVRRARERDAGQDEGARPHQGSRHLLGLLIPSLGGPPVRSATRVRGGPGTGRRSWRMRTSYAVGIDVGGTRIAAGLVERKGRIVSEERVLTPKNGPFGVIDAIIDLTSAVVGDLHASEIAGLGIGLPAQIDFRRQSVEFCTNLPLAGVDVRGLVMHRLKYEITIDNDGHTAALGEFRFGAAKGARDFLMVTLGTGVGGGMFLGGEPYRGSRGLGGEVGHTPVDLDGPECPCGARGHLEAYVGRPALAAKGREAAATRKGRAILQAAGGDIEAVTAESVIDAAREGDEVALGILRDAGEVFGHALVGFINVLNPQLLVIGGGVGESADALVDRAIEVMGAEALAGRKDARVVRAELGNDAGVLGAAALAFDEHDAREGLHR